MRFSGFLKETPVCKKKTHHKNIQKSRDKGQKLAQSLHDGLFFFFFREFLGLTPPSIQRFLEKPTVRNPRPYLPLFFFPLPLLKKTAALCSFRYSVKQLLYSD